MKIREATREDAGLILYFIKAIAEYEKLGDTVENNEEMIKEWIFDKQSAEVIFVMNDEKEVGFALFMHNYSTFVGRAGLYLEDLFVLPEYRGMGYGKALFRKLAEIAHERNYGRMEWVCLNWNKPSIDFYRAMGAEGLTEWTTYRLTEKKLQKIAKNEM